MGGVYDQLYLSEIITVVTGSNEEVIKLLEEKGIGSDWVRKWEDTEVEERKNEALQDTVWYTDTEGGQHQVPMRTPQEEQAWQDGYDTHETVLEEWLDKWDGGSNSALGAQLVRKFKELKYKI